MLVRHVDHRATDVCKSGPLLPPLTKRFKIVLVVVLVLDKLGGVPECWSTAPDSNCTRVAG
jgi:hypothetical protein